MELEVLPIKSREKYLRYYNQFKDFHTANFPESSIDDAVVQYLLSLREKKLKISTLRTYISAITSCLANDKIKLDDCTYKRIMLYLNQQGKVEEPKQSSVFTSEQIKLFLNMPGDLSILQLKVATILGVCGATRIGELYDIDLDGIEEDNSNGRYSITIRKSKTNPLPENTYVPYHDGIIDIKSIVDSYLEALVSFIHKTKGIKRPKCLWRAIRNNQFINQVIGVNSLSKFPNKIALMLNLQHVNTYTGHCFRRTAASILAANGSSEEQIMALGRWKAPAVAHRYAKASGLTKWKAIQGIIGGKKPASPVKTRRSKQECSDDSEVYCIFLFIYVKICCKFLFKLWEN